MSFGRILLGLLALLLVLGFFGYRWAAKIEPTAMTAADLDKGGDFSAEEKSAFTASCTTRIKKDADKTCGCLADKAATEFSRFERLTMTVHSTAAPPRWLPSSRASSTRAFRRTRSKPCATAARNASQTS